MATPDSCQCRLSPATHRLRATRFPTSRSWVAAHVRELWPFRESLSLLTWRDVKVPYEQAALGATWAIIQPVMTMLTFTLLFGKLAKVPSSGIRYPISAHAARLPETSFANATTTSGNSLGGSVSLITKVYFPRVTALADAAGVHRAGTEQSLGQPGNRSEHKAVKR